MNSLSEQDLLELIRRDGVEAAMEHFVKEERTSHEARIAALEARVAALELVSSLKTTDE